jgi:alpha-mannosidase
MLESSPVQHSLTLAKLKSRLPEMIAAATRATQPLDGVRVCPAPGYGTHDGMQQPAPPLDGAVWKALQPGETWGAHPDREVPPPEPLPWGIAPDGGSTHWLHAALRVPRVWQGQQVLLELEWQGSGQASLEAIVYLDHAELAGMDEFHRAVLLPAAAHSGEHTLLLRCTLPYPQPFGGLRLLLRDEHIFHLGQLMRVGLDAVETCQESAPARHAMLARLNEAYNLLDLREGWQSVRFAHSAHAALELLRHTLTAGIERGQRPRLVATGHAHLDVAWL